MRKANCEMRMLKYNTKKFNNISNIFFMFRVCSRISSLFDVVKIDIDIFHIQSFIDMMISESFSLYDFQY